MTNTFKNIPRGGRVYISKTDLLDPGELVIRSTSLWHTSQELVTVVDCCLSLKITVNLKGG